jgi:hypothetical protein
LQGFIARRNVPGNVNEGGGSTMMEVRLIFDGPLTRDFPSLIAMEDGEGRLVTVGQWRKRQDGYWEMVINSAEPATVIKKHEHSRALSERS